MRQNLLVGSEVDHANIPRHHHDSCGISLGDCLWMVPRQHVLNPPAPIVPARYRPLGVKETP